MIEDAKQENQMLAPEIREVIIGSTRNHFPHSEQFHIPEQPESAEEEDILDIALELLEDGKPAKADQLLTAALLEMPFDERLWLAAGISRLRRGAVRSAASAFEMSAWISDDPSARELLFLCGEITL